MPLPDSLDSSVVLDITQNRVTVTTGTHQSTFLDTIEEAANAVALCHAKAIQLEDTIRTLTGRREELRGLNRQLQDEIRHRKDKAEELRAAVGKSQIAHGKATTMVGQHKETIRALEKQLHPLREARAHGDPQRFTVAVNQDENKVSNQYVIDCDSEFDAMQIAFALDGGWGADGNATGLLELARRYCMTTPNAQPAATIDLLPIDTVAGALAFVDKAHKGPLRRLHRQAMEVAKTLAAACRRGMDYRKETEASLQKGEAEAKRLQEVAKILVDEVNWRKNHHNEFLKEAAADNQSRDTEIARLTRLLGLPGPRSAITRELGECQRNAAEYSTQLAHAKNEIATLRHRLQVANEFGMQVQQLLQDSTASVLPQKWDATPDNVIGALTATLWTAETNRDQLLAAGDARDKAIDAADDIENDRDAIAAQLADVQQKARKP